MLKTYNIKNLDCENCANKIENRLNKLNIGKITINYMNRKITIDANKIDEELIFILQNEIDKIEDGVIIEFKKENIQDDKIIKKLKYKLNYWRYIFAALFFVVGMFCPDTYKFIYFGLSYILVGFDIVKKCVKNILHGEIFDENFLMTIATIGAFAIGEYSESIFVMVFYKIGEYFQDKSIEKSRNEIINLVSLKKDTATIEKDNVYQEINLEDIKINDILVVKAGEIIPVDGIIIEGQTQLDMSSLTGESEKISKNINDEVLSGSINTTNLIKIKANKEYKNSTISKILNIIENSVENKSNTEKFITKFSKIYTPIVCLLALLIFLIPIFIFDASYKIWLYKALSFLVVSCPCALVISIPLGFFGGIGRASKDGILIKGSNFLDEINNIDNFIFDKTGTLTNGSFIVKEIKYLEEKDEINNIIYSLEINSTHPIARSIIGYLNKCKLLKIENFEEIVGKGIKGIFNNNEYYIGGTKILDKLNIKPNEDSDLYLIKNNKIISNIYISDGIKENAIKLTEYLNKKNKNIYMLTGDNEKAAKYVANKLNIKNYESKLMPIDKLNKVKQIDGKSLFVGDGINDAPVLLTSDIGISMGEVGSKVAIEASDIVIMNDDIGKVLYIIKISKYTKKIVLENIIFALSVKILVLVLITLGISTMWMAIFADVGVALLCILNSLRTLKLKL